MSEDFTMLVEDEDGAPYPDEVQRHFRDAYRAAGYRRIDPDDEDQVSLIASAWVSDADDVHPDAIDLLDACAALRALLEEPE